MSVLGEISFTTWVTKLGQYCFWKWLVVASAPSHCLNQCWLVNYTTRIIFECNFTWETKFCIHENALECIVCKMAVFFRTFSVIEHRKLGNACMWVRNDLGMKQTNKRTTVILIYTLLTYWARDKMSSGYQTISGTLTENIRISINISWKFDCKGPVGKKSTFETHLQSGDHFFVPIC